MASALPLYAAANCRAAYQLNWSLAVFWNSPAPPEQDWLTELKAATERDGVRILESRQKAPDVTQFLLSTTPALAPQEIIRSVKGRLQYLVRHQIPKAFHRNYSIKSVGSVTREVIDQYVGSQVERHAMADERVQRMLAKLQVHCPEVDLSISRRSNYGEYLFNLHTVLVNEGRWREVREEAIAKTREMIVGASGKKGHLLSRAGIVADHIHLMLGCGIGESPQEVALGYLNNLAFAYGMKPIFQFGFYAGTFGEYDLGAIRRALRDEA